LCSLYYMGMLLMACWLHVWMLVSIKNGFSEMDRGMYHLKKNENGDVLLTHLCQSI
jgi:hypothetical protein